MWQDFSLHTELKFEFNHQLLPIWAATSDPSSTSPPLQVSNCGKWRSSESRRPSTSAWATTWPPSCHAASQWSTPTRRTSLSSTRATGWSDRPSGGRERKRKKMQQQRTNMFRCSPPSLPPQPCGLCLAISPSCCGLEEEGKKKNVAHFSSEEIFVL